MRTYQYNSGSIKATITLPNSMSFTNSQFQYVKVDDGGTRGSSSADTLIVEYDRIKVTIQRMPRGNVVVFPLTSVLESIAEQMGLDVLRAVKLTYNGTLLPVLDTVIVGYYAYEIPDFVVATDAREITNPKMVLYPEFWSETRQYQYIPFLVGFSTNRPLSVELRNRVVLKSTTTEDKEFPFFRITAVLPSYQLPGQAVILMNNLTYVRIQPVEFDNCTDGVFLKWKDKSGIPRLYRWSLETTEEEADVENTYTRLDENLQPFDVQDKTLTTRYVLHSRMVEQDIYDLCKSIIGNRELFMWDWEADDWVRCYVDDAGAEDNGDILKDLTIEVVKYEYHI